MLAVPPRPSLITHAADFLREAILRGEWTGILPSERQLCVRLRISRPSLRAVLVQLEREGIISEVRHKKRHILSQAPSSPGGKPSVIVMLTPVAAQLMPPFVLYWMDALRGLLAEAGWQLEVAASPPCYSTKPAAGLKKLTQRASAAAWILFRSTPAMQSWFMHEGLPAVVAGTCTEQVTLPSVDIDYRAACRHAVTMLRRKGRRRIALLIPDASHGGDLESELGYLEALGAESQALILRHGESPGVLVQHLDKLLAQKPVPDAFLVARSMHVLTVITHLLRLRHRLPHDFAVVSRDDDAFLSHVVPQVTRYAADPSKFARRLFKLVIGLMENGSASSRAARLMPELRAGETA